MSWSAWAGAAAARPRSWTRGPRAAALRGWRDEHPDWEQYIALDKNAYDNAQELIRLAQRLRRGLDKLDSAIAETEAQLTLAEQAPPVKAQAVQAAQQRGAAGQARRSSACASPAATA